MTASSLTSFAHFQHFTQACPPGIVVCAPLQEGPLEHRWAIHRLHLQSQSPLQQEGEVEGEVAEGAWSLSANDALFLAAEGRAPAALGLAMRRGLAAERRTQAGCPAGLAEEGKASRAI